MKRSAIHVTLVSLLLGGSALAEPPSSRSPLEAMNSTRVQLTRFGRTARVTRDRSPGKTTARFIAEEGTVPQDAVLLFEAHSVADSHYTLRWRCVAEHALSECFSGPLELRYLPRDEQIVLTVTPVSSKTTRGLALVEGASTTTLAKQD
jgi:hypothetical protein